MFSSKHELELGFWEGGWAIRGGGLMGRAGRLWGGGEKRVGSVGGGWWLWVVRKGGWWRVNVGLRGGAVAREF